MRNLFQALNIEDVNMLKGLIAKLVAYADDESGATAIEYGILAAALATGLLAIFGGDSAFMQALTAKFNSIVTTLNGGAKE